MARNPSFDPSLRAGDADRDRTAYALREHHAAGRLTIDEFRDRLERTYAARTFGELDALTVDLPGDDLYRFAVATRRPGRPAPRTRGQVLRRRMLLTTGWSAWAFVSSLNLVLWLLVSVVSVEWAYPWWVWVAGPWGVAMLAAQLATRRRRR